MSPTGLKHIRHYGQLLAPTAKLKCLPTARALLVMAPANLAAAEAVGEFT